MLLHDVTSTCRLECVLTSLSRSSVSVNSAFPACDVISSGGGGLSDLDDDDDDAAVRSSL